MSHPTDVGMTWRKALMLLGAGALAGQVADFIWGAALAMRDLPLIGSPGIFTAFAYGLFGGGQ